MTETNCQHWAQSCFSLNLVQMWGSYCTSPSHAWTAVCVHCCVYFRGLIESLLPCALVLLKIYANVLIPNIIPACHRVY